MKTEMNLKDLKDLESFKKKILKDGEKRTREEAKNYLKLLSKGAESIWSWWHPSCLSSILLADYKVSPNGGMMFPFGIVWPSAMCIDAVKLSRFIDYCKKTFGEDAPIANGFITFEFGRLCYVWYLTASMRNGLSDLITEEANQHNAPSKKSGKCKIVNI